jgi:DNA polymerase III subunit delta'
MDGADNIMIRNQCQLSLDSFLGNARAVAILKRAIEQDRLPHAMIFSGPAGVGKCTLALLVAQYLNCLSPLPGGACGICAVCNRIMAVIESRNLKCLKLKDEGFCGSCSNCKIRTKRHPDVRLIEPEKTTIGIDQVRAMIDEVAFQPLEARYRVVILDPAEQMRPEAHNSLLKTLEEPASRTILILVTTNPYMLLETIRSRSRMLMLGEIPQDQIERYLVQTEGRSADEARLAAALSGGSLTVALNFNTEEYQDLRKQALHFVTLLLKKRTFADASAVAAKVGKEKQFFQLWLESVAALLQDIYYAGMAPERVGQRDLLGNLQEIARDVSRFELLRSIDAVKKLKSELHFNVNRQLALEAMFVSLTRN